jgi:hypothetical protein
MALFPLGILSAAAGGVAEGDYELIESYILGSSQSSVVFSSLGSYSSTYKHLQLRIVGRTDRSGEPGDVLTMRLNGDSGSNYAYHYLSGNGSSVVSLSGSASQTEMWLWRLAGNTATANSFGALVLDLLDVYATKNKTVRGLSGITGNLNEVYLGSGLWNSTASLTSISLDQLGSNFVSGSRFSLYGMKG